MDPAGDAVPLEKRSQALDPFELIGANVNRAGFVHRDVAELVGALRPGGPGRHGRGAAVDANLYMRLKF
jgi:hypothetical protein